MALKIKEVFFWTEWVKKVIWDPFWWVILFLIILWVPFLRVWWWVFLPIMLQKQLKTLYIWWIGWDYDYAKQKWVMLEITPPKEILIPLKAMEDVFAVIWPVYDTSNFRERWCDGELAYSPYWCSFELASIEGNVHFYIRALRQNRMMIETALFAHYPDLEIKEVQDYTKLIPPTIPNDEWDMYGEDFEFTKPDAYPIKTYEKFFEPQGERISAEEKRLDPIISLLEGMSKLGPGEHYWVHFVTYPVTDLDEPEWRPEGNKIVSDLMKREEKKIQGIFGDILEVLGKFVMGPKTEGSSEAPKYSWEENEETGERQTSLTPGERDLVTEIENKLKKPVFKTAMRGVYIAKRENWKAPHRILMRSYVAHFTLSNLNRLGWSNKTRPRVHYFWRKRRVFLRARKMFRNTVLRFPPLFPNRREICPIFSTEELATMYHFPLRVSGMVSPSMASVESRKAGPPPNLPVDE